LSVWLVAFDLSALRIARRIVIPNGSPEKSRRLPAQAGQRIQPLQFPLNQNSSIAALN